MADKISIPPLLGDGSDQELTEAEWKVIEAQREADQILVKKAEAMAIVESVGYLSGALTMDVFVHKLLRHTKNIESTWDRNRIVGNTLRNALEQPRVETGKRARNPKLAELIKEMVELALADGYKTAVSAADKTTAFEHVSALLSDFEMIAPGTVRSYYYEK